MSTHATTRAPHAQHPLARTRASRRIVALSAFLLLCAATPLSALAQGHVPSPWFAEGRPRLAAAEVENPDYVEPPWTSPTVRNGAVDVWGRSYVFNSTTGFMNATSAGATLLNGAVTLQATLGGLNKTFRFSAPSFDSVRQGKIFLSRTLDGVDGISGRIDFVVSYDGLVESTLSVDPHGASLQGLRLFLSFSGEQSQLIHYIGAPKKFDSQSRGHNSYSKELSTQSGTTLRLPFKTAVWIGNNRRGLQIGAESDQNWWPLDRPDSIEFRRNADGSGTLTLALVSGAPPASATGPFKYALTFMATPVKPMPEGWRGWTYSAHNRAQSTDRGNHVIYWGDGWRYYTLDPEPHRASAAQTTEVQSLVAMDRANAPPRKILPYWSRTYAIEREIIGGQLQTNTDTEWFDAHDGPDPTNPTITVGPGTPQRRRMGARSLPSGNTDAGWADYLVWAFNEWGKKFEYSDGLYLDDSPPIPNLDPNTGGGYFDFNQRWQPTFDYHGTRDILRRTNYLLRNNGDGRGKREPNSIVHNSATYLTFAMSPAAAFLTGEQFNMHYLLKSSFCPLCGADLPEPIPRNTPEEMKYYYSYALPMDRLRAEGYHQQWGVPIVWLGQLKFDDEDLQALQLDKLREPTRDFLSRVLQVDSLFWPITGLINRDLVLRAIKFRKEFGVADSQVTFTPYWDNADGIVPEWSQAQSGLVTKAINIGFYTHPGNGANKYLAIVSNVSRQQVLIRIRLTGIPDAATRRIRNAETGETVANSGGVIELVSLPRNDYLALIIE